MKPNKDLNEFQANRNPTEQTVIAPGQPNERQQHFLVPWRLSANTAESLWQQGEDIGCGSCPGE